MGQVLTGVTAILCTWEAIESFNSGDVNAGMALMWAGGAVVQRPVTPHTNWSLAPVRVLFASTLLSTGAIAAGSTLAVVASPAVIAVAAIGAIGFGLFAAFFLEDNPLEQLVKNCLLNDMGGLFTFKLNEVLREIKEGSAAEVVQNHHWYIQAPEPYEFRGEQPAPILGWPLTL
ncbi:hypothetical protein [Marinilabilia salmonicolor]|uniref:Uncharacterized protein n=1 Tax=Marinilabilia salmonicolor TaxID=989 RepID=A0A2T0WTW6_9BACT|nr:hypothetical protein [Marinilabilia salmonicolor]PRY90004.1 hypothetical protein BY457_12811 [Marinilabilia salmonicolor]RCW28835.1 hypothetical protein DFO77_13518 [Marinilabilia salmonicolor]